MSFPVYQCQEWQCRYVSPENVCCVRPIGHAGEHLVERQPADAVEHELKCWPEFYKALVSGEKTFELRKNDRGFRVGDVLWLREWRRLAFSAPLGQYTG